MFIGRERELASLNRLYNSGKFEFVVLYGRRRVGKTALINHFIDGKPAIYFMGVESNAKQNLENFSKSIMEYASGYEGDMSFLSFQAAWNGIQAIREGAPDPGHRRIPLCGPRFQEPRFHFAAADRQI